MTAPLISVIVPVYNGEAYIERCLASLLKQDAGDMEIIVVDDGSRDGTWALLERMAREDGRIRPVHQENAGVSAARNAALDICRGRYIRFADADDVAAEGSSAALIASMEETDSDLVIADYVEVTGPLRTRRSMAPDRKHLPLHDFLDLFRHRSNSFYYGVLWNKLFRGDIIRENGIRFPHGMKWGEDFHFVTDYLAHVRSVSYLTTPVYDYNRRMEGTVVRQFFDYLCHPTVGLKTRLTLYRNYRELYMDTGLYPRYRRTLWIFLVRFTLGE
ncbi:MAG: glycosyltransferase [Clostridia bacterium]|nr:glycosyltransferase [Clostridia bacterium]